jgi:hypothetical protein
MNASNQPDQQADLRPQVLASPAYQDRCSILFDLFRLSREIDATPKHILAIQAGLTELLMQFEEKKAEFSQEDNDLGVAVVKRLILILRQIADSLVWRVFGYDRVLVQLLSEHSKTGYLDDTVFPDIAIAQEISEQEDSIVLVNDLTTILRHADLTVVRKDGISVVETKYGKASRRSRRATRQRKRLDELLSFLNTGVRITKDRRDFILKADVPVRTHHSAVANALGQARSKGYHRDDASDVVVIEALSTKNQRGRFPKERPFDDVDHIARFHSLDTFDKPTTRIAPYGVFPFDDQSCWDVITGDTLLVASVNFDALQNVYGRFGLLLELPEPTEEEIRRYLSASIGERMKQPPLFRFLIRDDSCHVSPTPDLFSRIGLEFIHEETVVQADRQLMNLVKELDIGDEKRTRFYIGYRDESGVWA